MFRTNKPGPSMKLKNQVGILGIERNIVQQERKKFELKGP